MSKGEKQHKHYHHQHDHRRITISSSTDEKTANVNQRMSISSSPDEKQTDKTQITISSTNDEKKAKFSMNDNRDILVEILKRLDGRSLGVAACVCRLWCKIATTDDSVWEHVCFRHVSPPGARPLVLALGGYKKLYMVCVGPVLGRLNRVGVRKSGRAGRWVGESDLTRRVWTRQGAQLLLSLFCVDYYEKLGGNNNNGDASSQSSLMFLCKPVNV